MNNKKGFTLTEIMVAVLILASLAAIAYPMYSRTIIKSRMAEAISLSEIVRSAQQRHFIVRGTNSDKYFGKFVEAHVSGTSKLIKGNEAELKDGKLAKGFYMVTIKDPFSKQYPKNSCIEITYGEDPDNPVFMIQALVEDTPIYCWEQDNRNGLCDIISDSSPTVLCKK